MLTTALRSVGLVASLAATGLFLTAQQPQQERDRAAKTPAKQGAQMTGQALANQVTMNISSRSAFAGSQIQANASGSTVTLTGTVASDQMKQRAVEIAKRTPGVTEVRDQLTVRSAGAFREIGDEELARNVAQELAKKIPGARAEEQWLFGWQVQAGEVEFDVEADDGRIMLDGEVNSTQQIIEMIQSAHNLPGVRAVEVDLELNDTADRLANPPDQGKQGDPKGATGKQPNPARQK